MSLWLGSMPKATQEEGRGGRRGMDDLPTAPWGSLQRGWDS